MSHKHHFFDKKQATGEGCFQDFKTFLYVCGHFIKKYNMNNNLKRFRLWNSDFCYIRFNPFVYIASYGEGYAV